MDLTSRRSRARRYAVGRLALVTGVLAFASIAAACAQPSSDAPPSSVAQPVITGTVRVNSTLSTTVGEWAGDPTMFTHQWQSCDAAAPTSCTDVGTDGPDYVVAPSDLGRLVQVRVTGTDATGAATQLSVAVGPILPKLVEGSRAGVWAASGARQLCGVINGQQACGSASNVALGFSLVGDCDGIGGCKLTALTGDWDFGLVGGSACLSRVAGGIASPSLPSRPRSPSQRTTRSLSGRP